MDRPPSMTERRRNRRRMAGDEAAGERRDGQQRARPHQQQVLRTEPGGKRAGDQPAHSRARYATGGEQREEPLCLPGVGHQPGNPPEVEALDEQGDTGEKPQRPVDRGGRRWRPPTCRGPKVRPGPTGWSGTATSAAFAGGDRSPPARPPPTAHRGAHRAEGAAPRRIGRRGGRRCCSAQEPVRPKQRTSGPRRARPSPPRRGGPRPSRRVGSHEPLFRPPWRRRRPRPGSSSDLRRVPVPRRRRRSRPGHLRVRLSPDRRPKPAPDTWRPLP